MQNEVLVASADSNLIFGKEDVEFFRNNHIWFHEMRVLKKKYDYIALYLPESFGDEQGIHEYAPILDYQMNLNLYDLKIPKKSNFYQRISQHAPEERCFRKLILGDVITLPHKIGRSRGKRVFNWSTTLEKLFNAKWADELLK
jgi:hypothetical protein